jgi:hypothetical protein
LGWTPPRRHPRNWRSCGHRSFIDNDRDWARLSLPGISAVKDVAAQVNTRKSGSPSRGSRRSRRRWDRSGGRSRSPWTRRSAPTRRLRFRRGRRVGYGVDRRRHPHWSPAAHVALVVASVVLAPTALHTAELIQSATLQGIIRPDKGMNPTQVGVTCMRARNRPSGFNASTVGLAPQPRSRTRTSTGRRCLS